MTEHLDIMETGYDDETHHTWCCSSYFFMNIALGKRTAFQNKCDHLLSVLPTNQAAFPDKCDLANTLGLPLVLSITTQPMLSEQVCCKQLNINGFSPGMYFLYAPIKP